MSATPQPRLAIALSQTGVSRKGASVETAITRAKESPSAVSRSSIFEEKAGGRKYFRRGK